MLSSSIIMRPLHRIIMNCCTKIHPIRWPIAPARPSSSHHAPSPQSCEAIEEPLPSAQRRRLVLGPCRSLNERAAAAAWAWFRPPLARCTCHRLGKVPGPYGRKCQPCTGETLRPPACTRRRRAPALECTSCWWSRPVRHSTVMRLVRPSWMHQLNGAYSQCLHTTHYILKRLLQP